MNADNPIALLFVGWLAFNILVALVGLIAGPRHWVRRVCAITCQFTGFFLLATMAWLAYGAYVTDWSEEGQLGCAIILFAVILPLLGAFIALLAIYRWRLRSPPLQP